MVSEPFDLRSQNGELKVELEFRKSTGEHGASRFCYVDSAGHVSPNLRVHPGDLLTISLKNKIAPSPEGMDMGMAMLQKSPMTDACAGTAMTVTSTNLHFHGMSIPPVPSGRCDSNRR